MSKKRKTDLSISIPSTTTRSAAAAAARSSILIERPTHVYLVLRERSGPNRETDKEVAAVFFMLGEANTYARQLYNRDNDVDDFISNDWEESEEGEGETEFTRRVDEDGCMQLGCRDEEGDAFEVWVERMPVGGRIE